MLSLTWINNPDHVAYCKEAEIVPRLSRDLGISNLAQQINSFRENPAAEGVILRGTKRSSVRLFIPNLFFGETIDMGENVWLYLGEMNPAYCLYTPWENSAEA